MATFAAKYGGTCGDCGGRFQPGGEVTYNGANEIVHAGDCEPDLTAPAAICQLCFVALPLNGKCDCRE